MKPRLRKHKGRWLCGYVHEHDMWWAVAFTPEEAYSLWKRCQSTDAAAVTSAATT